MSLDVRGQSQHAVTLCRDVSIYSCSHVAEEGASAPFPTLLFCSLSAMVGLLDDFH